MIDQELQDLLAAWHGADVRSARLEELLAKLRADGEFRRRFAEEITILSEIKTVQSTSPRWLRVADSIGWNAEDQEETAVASDPDAGFTDRIIERIKQEQGDGSRPQGFYRRWWSMAAAAVVLIGSGLAYLGPWEWIRKPAHATESSPQEPLAVLLGAADVKWGGDVRQRQVGETLNAGLLVADAGRFSFTMLNGVTVSAEAPAELELVSLDTVVCRRGKLRIRVPQGAEGFSVNSPECTVVDRGTEFAVNVSPGLPTDVMVFDGRADVFVENKTDGGSVSTSIAEAEAVRVNPGADRPQNIEARPQEFTTMLPAEMVPLEVGPEYRELVLAAKPWGYWRFESGQTGVLENEVPGGPAFQMNGNIGFRKHPNGNRSLLFAGESGDTSSNLFLTDVWTPADGKGFAIELWFEAENFSNSTLISLLDAAKPMPHNEHYMVLEIVANKREMGNVRFLHRYPSGPSLGVNLSSSRIYVPCRWTHLVAQRDGDRLQLFVDGELASETYLDPSQSIGPSHVLMGRLVTPDFMAPGKMLRLFRGGLDEVALYDRALTAEEIRNHRAAVR